MASRNGNVLVAQGGGPTPVVNSSLHGVVSAMSEGSSGPRQIWGARGGIAGVFEENWIDLTSPSESVWQQVSSSPAAALGSCRKKLSQEEAGSVVEILRKLDIRYFLYIGGNDSMDTVDKVGKAARNAGYELYTVGVPKTIDNDLPETDHCPGYGSASRYYAQSTIDLGADVRSLPTPVSIMEVMGRNTGWLAAATVLAREQEDDAPHLVYVPEVPLSPDRFLSDVEAAYSRRGWVVVIVSEGLKDESGIALGVRKESTARDGFGHPMQGDVGALLSRLVTRELGIRARYEKPGLCARASALQVSPVDRSEAFAVGHFAARRALRGESRFMATIRREEGTGYRVTYGTVRLSEVANVERNLPLEYLSPEQNDLNETFRNYVEPLVGGPLRHHRRFF